MIKCPACDHDVADTDTKCSNCGTRVSTRASVTLNDIIEREVYTSYKVFAALVILVLTLVFLVLHYP